MLARKLDGFEVRLCSSSFVKLEGSTLLFFAEMSASCEDSGELRFDVLLEDEIARCMTLFETDEAVIDVELVIVDDFRTWDSCLISSRLACMAAIRFERGLRFKEIVAEVVALLASGGSTGVPLSDQSRLTVLRPECISQQEET